MDATHHDAQVLIGSTAATHRLHINWCPTSTFSSAFILIHAPAGSWWALIHQFIEMKFTISDRLKEVVDPEVRSCTTVCIYLGSANRIEDFCPDSIIIDGNNNNNNITYTCSMVDSLPNANHWQDIAQWVQTEVRPRRTSREFEYRIRTKISLQVYLSNGHPLSTSNYEARLA